MSPKEQAAKLLAQLKRGVHAVEMFAAEAKDRNAPDEIRLFRKGTNDTEYGPLLFDEMAGQLVMQRFRDRGVDVCIDYDHDTFAPFGTVSGSRPAAGWCQPEVRDGELWVKVLSWTDKAREMIAAGEYRYFSPTVEVDPDTRRVTCLLAVASCNVPATHAIDALVAASVTATQPSKETTMDPEKKILEMTTHLAEVKEKLAGAAHTLIQLAGVLGLSASASTDEVVKAVGGIVHFRKEVPGIVGKDTDASAIGAVTALKETAAEVVELRKQVEAAQTAQLSAEFATYLNDLSTTGRDGKVLTPAKRQKAEAMALKFGGGKLTKEGIEAAK